MIYLKKFNENNNIYYQQIDHTEYQNLMGLEGARLGKNRESMTSDDKYKIDNLLEPSNIEYQFDYPIISGSHHLMIKLDNAFIYINKVKDEWFLVAYIYNDRIQSKSYKCDQLDGLLKFLEDEISDK